ncbi:MAG: efflux RND transporter periplasmic adaptor subunit [Clostridiales bacterium]|nr:efflux RND transporter periplasmic adaptor subunit [Clostridiales bacterium]
MNWKRFLSLTVAGAMALAMTGCQSKEEDSSQQDDAAVGVAVQVQQVELSSIATDNNVSGKVAADSQTSIMVAAAAKCTAVYVEAGDEVKAGDKICTLDLASTIAAYNAAKITYDSTVNSYADQKAVLDKQIALYEKNLKDTKALFDIGAASQAEIDQAELTLMGAKNQRETALSQLEAGMQSYKSNVQQLDQVLQDVDSKGNVIAPVSGTLVSLSATENGYVSASMPVAVINGAEQMKITVSVSEALVPKLAIGDQADVVVSAAGAQFSGTVRSVEKAANMQTQLYTVTLSVPAEVSGLLSGMFAEVTFHTDRADGVITVPSQAILTSGDTRYVFVVEDGAAKYVEVTLGMMGSGVTEVTSGLTAGQQLVTVGQSYLSDGDPVRIVSGEG